MAQLLAFGMAATALSISTEAGRYDWGFRILHRWTGPTRHTYGPNRALGVL